MFSLIISIIAIALVAALALASIYYGGSAFQEGSADAEASTVVNQGQQIQGALTLAKVKEHKFTDINAPTLSELVTGGYLKEVPVVRANSWSLVAGSEATVAVANAEICEKINERAGHKDGASPSVAAGDENYALPGTKNATFDEMAFGCYGTGTAFTAFYKM